MNISHFFILRMVSLKMEVTTKTVITQIEVIFNYFAYNKNVFLAQGVVAGTLCMFYPKIYECSSIGTYQNKEYKLL